MENFPGFADGIDANELMDSMRKQAERFGADIRTATATKVDLSQSPYTLWFDDDTVVKCRTLVIATGASAKYLGLSDEKKYQGQGVSACATCDGFFYRKKVVAIVGGGDTSCEEATYLAGLASCVCSSTACGSKVTRSAGEGSRREIQCDMTPSVSST